MIPRRNICYNKGKKNLNVWDELVIIALETFSASELCYFKMKSSFFSHKFLQAVAISAVTLILNGLN